MSVTTLDLSELTPEQAELQARARRFVEEVLIPLEEQAERRTLPDDAVARIKSEAIAAELHGGLHAREHGGQGWTKLEWVLVEEQFGRSTNALSWHIPTAYNVLARGSPEQIDRWLRPSLRGELPRRLRGDRGARGLGPVGHRDDRPPPRRRLGDRRREVVRDLRRHRGGLHRRGERRGGGADAVPRRRGAAGISVVDDPPFTHTYPHGHPTIRFRASRCATRT